MRAKVFREGHDAVNATAVLTDPDGREHYFAMHCDNPGTSEWSTTVVADAQGWWTYRVEGWSDPFATWVHDAGIKIAAGVDEELMCAEGVIVLERFADAVRGQGADAAEIDKGVQALKDTALAGRPPLRRGDLARDPGTRRADAAARVRLRHPPPTRCSSSASGPSTARGTRSSRAPRGATSTRRPACGSRARSAPRRCGCRRSPRWASTSST